MDVPSLELNTESQTDTFPLLMERPDTVSSSDHVIDMPIADASPSISSHDRTSNHLDSLQREDRSSASVRTPISQPATSNGSNNRNFSFVRRGDARRRRSPLNSGLWISVELVLTVSQIIASVVVLSVSRDEHPRAPLIQWIVGYASGCVATLPLLYWRYRQSNHVSDPDSVQSRNGSARVNVPGGPLAMVSRNSEGEDQRAAVTSHRGGENTLLSAR